MEDTPALHVPVDLTEDVPVADRTFARLLADRRIWPMFLFRALSLQGTHPTVMVALEQHSKSFTEPSVRAENTLAYTYRIYFGDDVAESARELREMHRPITGQDYEGRRYHAWNRDVWTWVHLTTIESLIYAIETCFGPQPGTEVEAFYQESRRLGVLFGVREQDMPTDVAGLRAYVEDGVAEKLAMSPGTRRMQRLVDEQDVIATLEPALAALPRPLPALLERLTARPVKTLMFGAFPEPVRQIWGVQWSTAREREFRAILAFMRVGSRLVPERLRMIPEARAALGV
ncbi:oxygenase MpaB family protein [Rhodococcus sp. CH91]|uniref:oxygenase MpaB family protein n=1 Tax=Rhodococcus sp. CH91 TaxID=2910256 RepID=UPI001F4A7754|nr:oxygenase MpaB family protein [Rhodococcus sp. CH91]